MEIRPILASLRKHKIPACLLILEIALACAVFCNAVFMIGHRVSQLHMHNAIDESGIVDISVTGTDPKLVNADIPRNLAALRGIAGVKAAAAVSAVPFGEANGVDGVTTSQDSKQRVGAPRYMISQGGTEALGLQLLKGRFFNATEYAVNKLDKSYSMEGHVVIVTEALAHRLWPGQNAVGRKLWLGDDPYTVIGIVANVAAPGGYRIGSASEYYSTFFPLPPSPALTHYLLRTTPAQRGAVLDAAVTTLQKLAPNAVINGTTVTQLRDRVFASTRAMVWMLVLVCVIMLVVTAFGIVGLTSFWVRQRRRQIGIRRAVGATRVDILNYFHTENFILSTLGVALGVVLAFGANLYLMQHYQLDRMPLYYLLVSAVALWTLGQLAVLGPALRASNVPPVVATRSV